MKAIALAAILALSAAVLLGGGAPFGRLALSAGLPRLAAMLFSDPGWRGVALYRAGLFGEAAAAFEARAFYNLGNAEAHSGHHAKSLEAFDIAIAADDADARANFNLVAAYYAALGIDPDALALFAERKEGAKVESFVGEGDGRAAGTGDETTNSNTMMGLAKLESSGRASIRRVFDDAFMIADDRWLAQLADVPGEYLAARIEHERKRRAAAGRSPPEAEDPR